MILPIAGLLLVGCKTPTGLIKGRENPLAHVESPQRNAAGFAAPSWNNAGSRNLPVSVGFKDSYHKVETSLPFIALTFDDGPHPSNTPRLLDILKKRNIKAICIMTSMREKINGEKPKKKKKNRQRKRNWKRKEILRGKAEGFFGFS
ncbi:MAG: hypothetical protein CMO47_04500, partial [Verrucomicrobiales bacterium]|nr:hypothetical protein [Verrucomicrobiales bacterium]